MAATLDDIYTEVRAMLLGLFSCEVVRGYSNNVPLPKPPFVVMNILNETAAATNTITLWRMKPLPYRANQKYRCSLTSTAKRRGRWRRKPFCCGAISTPANG